MQPRGVTSSYPFEPYQPVQWEAGPPGSGLIVSVTRDHGVRGALRLHNPRDEINEGREFLDRVIVGYQIGRNHYDLFRVSDLFDASYAFEPRALGNIMGDTAERIARRITKYFLQHFSRRGRTGGIFDRRFDPRNRDSFVVAHTDRYVLKIDRYPNLIILKKSGRGKYGYENIKELDGLFDYRYGHERHLLVLESKLERAKVRREELVTNLFEPLSEFFPQARFTYVLFSDREAFYVKKHFERRRRLRHSMVELHEALAAHGVGTLLFTFNESRADFERAAEHLITQHRAITNRRVVLHGRMMVSDREIVLFDGGETPHLKLVRDRATGLWREVKMTHKKRRAVAPPASGAANAPAGGG